MAAPTARAGIRAGPAPPRSSPARSRERAIRHDPRRCKDRRRIEAAFCRLEDFRRAATRYGKLAAHLAAAVARAALVASWC